MGRIRRQGRKSKNPKIPRLDSGGTILRYLSTGEYERDTPGGKLAATRFFMDSKEVIGETAKYYRNELREFEAREGIK